MRGIKYYMLKVFALWVVIYNLFCMSDFFFKLQYIEKGCLKGLKHQKHREQFQFLILNSILKLSLNLT